MSGGQKYIFLESLFQKDVKKFSSVIVGAGSQKNIRHHKLVFHDTYVNHLKCNIAITLVKPQATQILSVGFSDYNSKQLTKFSYLFSFKNYYCLNSKIDAVSWVDHNFSAIPSVIILFVV